MQYIKLFEDFNPTFRDSGIKVIDLTEYRNGSLEKERFKSYEKKLLNNFFNVNRELISDECFRINRWVTFSIPSKVLYITIICAPHSIFNVQISHSSLVGAVDPINDNPLVNVYHHKTETYYQCDEIESVIRLLKKTINENIQT